MRVCFIGAYPPELGSASQQAYWAAYGLADRGHQVLVVTAATSCQAHLDERDIASYQPRFAASGGSVQVLCPAVSAGQVSAGKEASLADLASESRCDALVASANEPYAAAGYLAAQWSGMPLLLWPDAAEPPLPGSVFHSDAPALGPAEIETLDAAVTAPRSAGGWQHRRRFVSGLPCIGACSGSLQSTRRLLAALSLLRAEGLDCNAVLMCETDARSRVRSAAAAAGLADSTWLLPMLPHWRMPGFIRACTAVCVLDRSAAPIAAEVLACGTCLVMPECLLTDLSYGDQLHDGASAVIVPPPADAAALASRLRAIIAQPATAAAIGASGHLVSRKFPAFSEFTDRWESRIRAISDPGARALRPAGRTVDLPDMFAENAIATAERACRGRRWLQFGITLPRQRAGQHGELYAALRDVAEEVLTDGLAAEFFYMHKPPGMRLRFQETEGTRRELGACLRQRLSAWQRYGVISEWRPGVYEPEEHLFGGPVSMRSVHHVFTADSLAWLGYHSSRLSGDQPGPDWAMSLLMVRALLEALRIDGWEDRDVWDRVRRQAGRRLGPATSASPDMTRLSAQLAAAWSAPDTLTGKLSGDARQLAAGYREAVLDEGKRWRADHFDRTTASAGPRETAAFMIIFHWNRGGFPMARQQLLTSAMLHRRMGADQ
jgi:thiopeptide-type bacteriocin biosynthesis protein